VRLIDIKCAKCERVVIDHLERDEDRNRPVCCEQPMGRVYLPTNRGQVIGDDIPGGLEIKNGRGLINPDGTPRKYYSHTELNRAAKAAGWENHVVHIGSKGGDKSKHTSRWV
jgi:hypothetical protein